MEAGTKSTVTVVVVVILLALIGAWWYAGFSVDFMRFFASENVEIDELPENEPVNQPATPAPPAGSVRCSPATQTIAKDAETSLTATGGNNDYIWTAPEGSPATGTGTEFKVAFSTAGTKKVLVGGPRESVASGSDRSPYDVIACTVVVTP